MIQAASMNKQEIFQLFEAVPVEEETTILSAAYGTKDSIPFRIEEWSWDGIQGKTVIVHSEHCPALISTEEDLKSKFDIHGSTTFKTVGQYYFLNYDFSF